ncbi:MAG: ATP synthase F0 subunit B [Terriglobia bacterium]
MKSAARRAWMTLLFGACLLGSAGLFRASSADSRYVAASVTAGEEGGEPKHEALFKWINFVILAGGLAYVLRKPLREFFTQRSASIRKSLEEGRKALEASQAQLQAVEEKLQHFEEEMAAFRAAALREMDAERERLRQATAHEMEKMLASVQTQMEMTTKQARVELKLYAAEQAVEMAQKMIGQRLDEAGQQRLVRQFMAGLKAGQTSS